MQPLDLGGACMPQGLSHWATGSGCGRWVWHLLGWIIHIVGKVSSCRTRYKCGVIWRKMLRKFLLNFIGMGKSHTVSAAWIMTSALGNSILAEVPGIQWPVQIKIHYPMACVTCTLPTHWLQGMLVGHTQHQLKGTAPSSDRMALCRALMSLSVAHETIGVVNRSPSIPACRECDNLRI